MDSTKYNQIIQSWLKNIEQNSSENPEFALMYCEDVIAHGREIGDNSLVALGYYHKGVIFYLRNDGNAFYQAVTEALSCLSLAEDWELLARCYNFLGIFSVNHGNAAIGMDYYLTAIRACDVIKNEQFKSMVMVNLGVLHIIYGRYDDAIEVLEVARNYFSEHPEHPRYEEYMVGVHQNLAKAYLCKGELIESKCCFENIYSEHREYLNSVDMLSVWATEAMYYHTAGKDKKCEDLITKIYGHMSDNFPVMDIFDDVYDYCKVLLERNKKDEFWKIVDIVEPSVKKLDIPNMILKILSLKIEYYRRHEFQNEYLQTAAEYYEYAVRATEENRYTMYNVLNLRKTLELVNQEKRQIEEANLMLQKKSETDALTGLNNRFGFDDYSERALQKALENQTVLAVELLDLDEFKGYNDTLGHQMGDICIQKVAEAIKTMEEFGAYTARYGGDEFILIYEGKTKEELITYAAELRKRVLDLHIDYTCTKGKKQVTISQGICWDIPVKGNRVWDYLHAADDMLYRVKQRKRNNFCIGNLTEDSEQVIMSYL